MTTQQLEALRRGNEVRSYRATLRRKIKAGEVSRDGIVALVTQPPPEVRTMELERLVSALPGFAKTKARTLLKRACLPTNKRVCELEEGERLRFALVLRCWPQRP